jgi:hypothetical protein
MFAGIGEWLGRHWRRGGWMTRWGFCEGLGVYDVFEQLSVEMFYGGLYRGGLLKKKKAPI